MAMDDAMDSSSLLHLSPRELALHLRRESAKQSVGSISTHLLKLIELEALPPTVFNDFLTSVESPCPVKDALWQRHSKHVRYAAIRRFGKNLKSAHWKDSWQEVGGTEGLLDLFSQISVSEVKELSLGIGSCQGRSAVKNGIERQRRITELLQSLMHHLFPSSAYESRDQRPLHGRYAQMVPACTAGFVEDLLRQQSHPLLESQSRKRLMQNHFELLRQLVLDAVSQQDSLKGAAAHRVLDYLPLLLHFSPSVPVLEPNFSACMSLAVSILKRITVDKEVHFPEREFMPMLMVPLMRRLKAHKVDLNRVRQIIQLAAKYLQRHEHARAQLSPVNLMFSIADYWSLAAPLFRECIVDFIGLLRPDPQSAVTNYKWLIDRVAKPQRYDLLRIIYLHGTDIRADIESDDGLKAVPIEKWPILIFHSLQRDHSLSLLQRLVRLKPKASFLDGDTHSVLASFQPRNEDEDPKQIVETLKLKASKSRAQTDRASFAKSAAIHAIASGSLELYGDVVQWNRRFLRDAMTVKVIYSPSVTRTAGGIALLGGIPKDLNPWNAADIRTKITKANTIMLNFMDTAVMSLREPSFHAPDWIGPRSLFRDVVMGRMTDAGRLKSHFQLSEDEVYDLLWSETTKMLLQAEEIGLQYEDLGFNSPEGLLGLPWHTEQAAKPELPSSYRFVGT